jgi:hypothetical protein
MGWDWGGKFCRHRRVTWQGRSLSSMVITPRISASAWRRMVKKYLTLGVILLALTIVFVRFWRSPVERVLGVRLPKTGKLLNFHMRKYPGYRVISEGFLKMELSPQYFEEFVRSLGLTTNRSSYLPTQDLPKEIMDWWNVPESQHKYNRAFRMDDSSRVNLLQVSNQIYLEFSGKIPVARWD